MKKLFFILFLLCSISFMQANATILIENFNDPFPAWESGWLGLNTNLENYYVSGGSANTARGNNPYGLWISDGDGILYNDPLVEIFFNPSFGYSISSLSMDIAAYQQTTVSIYDMSNSLIFQNSIYGGSVSSNPPSYINISTTSANGVSRFTFYNSSYAIEGNTAIDNVMVTLGDNDTVIPEPTTLSLLGLGLAGLIARTRKKKI